MVFTTCHFYVVLREHFNNFNRQKASLLFVPNFKDIQTAGVKRRDNGSSQFTCKPDSFRMNALLYILTDKYMSKGPL